MILNFMRTDALDTLKSDISNNVERYTSNEVWINDYFETKNMRNYSFGTGICCPDIELTVGDSKTDIENSQKLYLALKDKLNVIQASDLRLWAYLAHDLYWDYMRVRWPIEVKDEEIDEDEGEIKLSNRINSRYFFGASKGKAFVRQGIARLWWSAYLTYDEKNPNDPFEYTKFFLSKQDIFLSATERSLARNKVLLLAALKELKDQNSIKRKDIRKYFLKLNQAGGLLVLDALNEIKASELAKRILDKVIIS